MRYVLLLALCGILVNCGGQPRIKTVYEDKYIPIPFCPAPPGIVVPEYYAAQLNEQQKNDIGELSKAYVISSHECVNHVENLQRVYDLYAELAKRTENRINALEDMGENVDRSLLDQANREISSIMQALSVEMEAANAKHSTQMLQSLNQMNENP